ncbi:putative diguanylate cyclase YedQ [Variibacter gotjawalensis]|uniref:diguanylate cyclase n=1 Tax=Variibacter gotjawalensis TaxID=1333996 RepID=A0A0S3PP12_9BRAD|nr:GGDEF domain-containing protein [Variibacter gotjawalensis]NIK47982.1 diguanylate cyclase (GGDEF)-like protein [Variibacter gotjawalensis]RZS49859.1 diguanylate cyclase (GGDEF)-like protein [Variibacter gotjawalensis]BAT57688.1 putative diguanylate cyclase YedQ [Variibacter gotjawalensis]
MLTIDTHTISERSRKVGMTVTSWLTCGLISVMLMCVLATFLYIDRQQSDVAQVRLQTHAMMRMQHSIAWTHLAVLELVLQHSDQTDFGAYSRALNVLNTQSSDALPKMTWRGTATVPTSEVLETLKSHWAEIIAALNVGQPDRARAVYLTRDVSGIASNLLKTMTIDIDRYKEVIGDTQLRIQNATTLALILQILSGIFCICAFAATARTGARDAKARDIAVCAANASREQVTQLFEMTEMLQSATERSDANVVLRSAASELMPDFGGALYVFNNSRDRLTLSTTWNQAGEDLPDSIGLQQCWAMKRGKPHINRADGKKLSCEHHTGNLDVLEIPMIARGEILGLLQIFASGENAVERLQQQMGLGSALADAMSLALANISLRDKLRSQALRDPLTGLYNRRYMEDALERTVRMTDREKQEVSVIMIDLDHFKRLNDQHGHAKGDSVLRDTAAVIMSQLRDTDIACRYGGEELIVVMPNCDLDAAAQKAESLRAAIEALSEPNGAKVSASLGVAAIPSTSHAVRDMVASADAALYRAKQDGRNRVALASRRDEPATELPENVTRLEAAE